jgi:cytochrome oxidase Cu insertion factor (SCO1/SenC/PrrC family)
MAKAFSFLVVVLWLVWTGDARARYGLGDQVDRDFLLTDLDGNTHSLADYAGQMILLNFFTVG